MIAAGLGCRKDCDVQDILNALSAALERTGRTLADVHALYAPDFKREEAGLAFAAEQLGKRLVHVPLELLQAQAAAALTRSAQVAERFGLPSVAETAALAGACALGSAPAGARLLGPRNVFGGATCALATAERAT